MIDINPFFEALNTILGSVALSGVFLLQILLNFVIPFDFYFHLLYPLPNKEINGDINNDKNYCLKSQLISQFHVLLYFTAKLIEIMKNRFISLGGVIFEGCSFSSIRIYEDAVVSFYHFERLHSGAIIIFDKLD